MAMFGLWFWIIYNPNLINIPQVNFFRMPWFRQTRMNDLITLSTANSRSRPRKMRRSWKLSLKKGWISPWPNVQTKKKLMKTLMTICNNVRVTLRTISNNGLVTELSTRTSGWWVNLALQLAAHLNTNFSTENWKGPCWDIKFSMWK